MAYTVTPVINITTTIVTSVTTGNITTISAANTTPSDCRIVVPSYTSYLTVLSCSLSIFGTAVIILTFVNIPEVRNFTRKLLLALTLADVLTAVGNLMGIIRYIVLQSMENGCELLQESDSVCVVQSFVTTFSSMVSFFWTTVIAVHIYLQIAHSSPGMRSGQMLLGYHILCWGVPGIIVTTAVSFNVLGSDNSVGTGGWCWIRSEINDDAQIVWMVITGKGWEILCYVLTAGIYMMSKISMWSQNRERRWRRFEMKTVEDMRNEDANFLYVPLVLYVLRMWGTIRFSIATFQKHTDNVHINLAQDVLLVLQSIGDCGQAFCNCILFCFCDETVRHYLYRVLSRQCRRRGAYEELEENETASIQT